MDSTNVQCTSCEGPGVSGWCKECGEALCTECVSAHKRVKMTRSHTIQTQPLIGGSPFPSPGFCQLHKRELIKLFCFTCNQLTCRDCQLMDHRNHSFQFIHEAISSQKKYLDSLVHDIRTRRDQVAQSVIDMDYRLEDIAEHKNKLRNCLKKALVMFAQRFKERLYHLYSDVEQAYRTEIIEIEKRKGELKRMKERQEHVAEFVQKALNEDHFPTLLAHKTQIESQLSEVWSQETTPPESMISLNIHASRAAYNQIFSFGEVQVRTHPFSVSQTRPDKSSAIDPILSQEVPSTAMVFTSSSSGPPEVIIPPRASSEQSTQFENTSNVDLLNSVNRCPTSQQVLSDKSCNPPSSWPQVDQSNIHGSTTAYVDLTSDEYSTPGLNPAHTLPDPVSNDHLTSVPKNSTQLNSTFQQVLLNQSRIPPSCQPNADPSSAHGIQPTPVSHTSVGQCPTIPNPVQTSLAPASDIQITPVPANYVQPNSNSGNNNMQANVTSNHPQTSITIANPSLPCVGTVQVYQSSLLPMQNSLPTTTNANKTQVPVSQVCYSLSSPVLIYCVGSLQQPENLVLNHGPSIPAAVNQCKSSPVSKNHYVSLIDVGKGQDQSFINSVKQAQSFADSPVLTPKAKNIIRNHPMLVDCLSKVPVLSPSSESQKEKDETSIVSSPDNSSTANTDQISTSSSHAQNHTIFLTSQRQPTHTVKALADSACDSSTSLASDPNAESSCKTGENEPSSTVTEVGTAGIVHCSLPPEFLSLWKDVDEWITLDSDPDPENTITENTAHKAGSMGFMPKDAENQHSSMTFKNETDLMGFEYIASLSSQNHSSSATDHVVKDEHIMDDVKEEIISTRSDLNPIRLAFRRKSVGSRFEWKVGKPSERKVHEVMPLELNSKDGYGVCNPTDWQPIVSLFRLPISKLSPSRPLPRFLLVPGDGENEIHLQEVDEDGESLGDDLGPQSSPESPPLFQFVPCAACGSTKGSIVCGVCGRGYHKDCHIPLIGPSIQQEWKCSLCQDLSDLRDPYSDERRMTPCLSLLDHRKCEHLLLYLICDDSSNILHHTEEVSGASTHLKVIQERLCHRRSPPYRSTSEFVLDVWVLFENLSTKSVKENGTLTELQGNFEKKLAEIFGTELHASLRKKPFVSLTSLTEMEEDQVKSSQVNSSMNESGSEEGSDRSRSPLCKNSSAADEKRKVGPECLESMETDAQTHIICAEADEERGIETSKPLRHSPCLSNRDLTTTVCESPKSLSHSYTSQTEGTGLPKLNQTRKRLRELMDMSELPLVKKRTKENDKDERT